MLRIRYLYAQPLPPAPKLSIPGVPVTDAISRHLERVGNTIEEFGLRRELLASSSRLAEAGCELPKATTHR
jgi:hypothetical protein